MHSLKMLHQYIISKTVPYAVSGLEIIFSTAALGPKQQTKSAAHPLTDQTIASLIRSSP